MSDELKPVRCGCGGEAKIDWTVINGYYMAGVVCSKCGTKTVSFYERHDKDKAITEAITAWNTAMGAKDINVPAKSVENIYSVGDHDKIYVYGFCPECGSAVIKPDKYCSECGCRLEWDE